MMVTEAVLFSYFPTSSAMSTTWIWRKSVITKFWFGAEYTQVLALPSAEPKALAMFRRSNLALQLLLEQEIVSAW